MECYDKKCFEFLVLKRKKIKVLIDKFFLKEYKNIYVYKLQNILNFDKVKIN